MEACWKHQRVLALIRMHYLRLYSAKIKLILVIVRTSLLFILYDRDLLEIHWRLVLNLCDIVRLSNRAGRALDTMEVAGWP